MSGQDVVGLWEDGGLGELGLDDPDVLRARHLGMRERRSGKECGMAREEL